jgi:hypothetical protein
MDTNIIIAISVSVSVTCLCCACILGERLARARREEEGRQFRAAVSTAEIVANAGDVDEDEVVCT